MSRYKTTTYRKEIIESDDESFIDETRENEEDFEFHQTSAITSTPKSNKQPRQGDLSSKEIHTIEPTQTIESIQTQNINSNSSQKGGQSQQTQKGPLLTSTQLHALIGDEIDSTVDSSHNSIESSRIGPLPISNDDDAHVSSSGSDSEARETKATPTDQGDFVEETPLRPRIDFLNQNREDKVSLLYLWPDDKCWWPCVASKRDWDSRARNAHVKFRNNDNGFINLNENAVLFDLKLGDKVHVVGSKHKGKGYKVHQLDKNVNEPLPSYATDSYEELQTCAGENRVVLEYRNKTESVPISEIYLNSRDMVAWKHSREERRAFNEIVSDFPSGTARQNANPASVANRSPTKSPRKRPPSTMLNSNPTTPTKRLERQRDHSRYGTPESKRRRGLRIFENCLFSVTMNLNDDKIKKLIEKHGGTVLDNGLMDVVHLQSGALPLMGKGDVPSYQNSLQTLLPNPVFKINFGTAKFMCVIADSPRKTIKYLEMVALGWPCLSAGFIHDCIDNGELLDWVPYLLPAGTSELPQIKHEISANCSNFHKHWLNESSLETQFRYRRVLLRPAVAIFILTNGNIRFEANKSISFFDFGDESSDEDDIEEDSLYGSDSYQRRKNKDSSDNERILLLAALCVPLDSVKIVNKQAYVPPGSLLLELENSKHGVQDISTPANIKYDLHNYAALATTLHKTRAWLVQCIINGKFV